MRKHMLRTILATVAIAGASVVMTPTSAQAADACKKLYAPNGAGGTMCKSWNRIGNTEFFNGEWWSQGPFPTKISLKVIEDGWQHDAAFSGSYRHRKVVQLKLCYTLTGQCGTPW